MVYKLEHTLIKRFKTCTPGVNFSHMSYVTWWMVVFQIVINEAENRMALPRQYPDKLIMVAAVRGVSFLVKLYV